MEHFREIKRCDNCMKLMEDVETPGRGNCDELPIIRDDKEIWVVENVNDPPCKGLMFDQRYIIIDSLDNGQILDRKYCYK